MNLTQKQLTYIIIPVHNRKNITLSCLKNLSKCGALERYHILVVDDGSTDSTAEAVMTFYPDVTILYGDGNLWWTGAIKRGMQYAIAQGAEYLIWLNDDCYPKENAIETLLDICKLDSNLIVGGQSLDPDTLEPTYGGVIRDKNKITHIDTSPGSILECDGLSGNFVCMPHAIVESIGYPNDKVFPHYYADVAYTYIAKQKGYKPLVCGDAVAFCKIDCPMTISWLTDERPLTDVWKERFTIKSPTYWRAELQYYKLMLGTLGVWKYIYVRIIKFFLIAIIVFVLPKNYRLFLKRVYNKFKINTDGQ